MLSATLAGAQARLRREEFTSPSICAGIFIFFAFSTDRI
jgi:hypothetical protein